jgi:hypothetical protein
MEASNISWIVYELVRVKDDRNSMRHEDVLGHYQAKLQDLRSKNRRLTFQLKDLYGKYERAMRCDESSVEGNRAASSMTKVPSKEVSDQLGISLKDKSLIGKSHPTHDIDSQLNVRMNRSSRGHIRSSTKTAAAAAAAGSGDSDVTGTRRLTGDLNRNKNTDSKDENECSSVDVPIPQALTEGIATSARSDIVLCNLSSSTEGTIFVHLLSQSVLNYFLTTTFHTHFIIPATN